MNQPEAQRALTPIGTNALPFLIEWLDEEPTRFDTWTWRIGNRLPDSVRPNPWPFGSRRDIAAHALEFLGTNAIPAIPELIRTFGWNWTGGSPPHGQYALANIGPTAIPALLQALEEDPKRVDPVVRTLVLMGRPNWQGPRTTQALHKVVDALDLLTSHPNEGFRLAASGGLMFLNRADVHEEVRRVWIKLLQDESSAVRAGAVQYADLFSPESPRLDLIVQLRDDPDAKVRAEVERVLQKAGRLGPLTESANTTENQ